MYGLWDACSTRCSSERFTLSGAPSTKCRWRSLTSPISWSLSNKPVTKCGTYCRKWSIKIRPSESPRKTYWTTLSLIQLRQARNS
jgi:hypothetical protein